MSLLDDSINQCPCTADAYDVYAEIGTGAFATVYRAVIRETGEEVAIKVIDLDLFNASWDEIRKEISTMSLLNHPNVTKTKGSFVDGQDLWIVMPYKQAGSCAAIMKQLSPKGFKDDVLLATILKEALQGLAYLHKDGKIHRDVKAGNILIGAKGEVEIADFGVAGTLLENGDRKKTRGTFTGTPCWMAPEVMEQTDGYDEKADIWSFGITAMELAYGRAPYAKFQPMKVMLLTLGEDPPTCAIYDDDSYKFNKHFESMIEKSLRKDPSKRPSAKKLLEHKFFKLAKDADYIVEKICSKLPKPSSNTNIIKVKKKEGSVTANQQRKNTGAVEVGQWVFDDDEMETIKKAAEEQKTRINKQNLVEDSDDDYSSPLNSNPTSPATKPNNNKSHSNQASSHADILSSFDPLSPDSISNNNNQASSTVTHTSSSSSTSGHQRTTSSTTTSTAGRFQVADIVLDNSPSTSPQPIVQPTPLLQGGSIFNQPASNNNNNNNNNNNAGLDLLSPLTSFSNSTNNNNEVDLLSSSLNQASLAQNQSTQSQVGRFSVTDSTR